MDDSLGIDWRIPTEHANLSEKDTKHEVLKDFESPFEYQKKHTDLADLTDGTDVRSPQVLLPPSLPSEDGGGDGRVPFLFGTLSELEKSAQERIYLKLVEEIEL